LIKSLTLANASQSQQVSQRSKGSHSQQEFEQMMKENLDLRRQIDSLISQNQQLIKEKTYLKDELIQQQQLRAVVSASVTPL